MIRQSVNSPIIKVWQLTTTAFFVLFTYPILGVTLITDNYDSMRKNISKTILSLLTFLVIIYAIKF